MRSDFKDIVIVVILWAIYAAIGLTVILTFTPFPVAAAKEAHLVDEAFTLLTLFAVPVFTFVIAVLSYGALKFRKKGDPTEDGPPERGQKPLILTWFGVTTVLTAVLIVHPGVTGILELREHDAQPADVVVQVEGQRFSWRATYLNEQIFSRRELVLPIDEHIQFNISVADAKPQVLHSFWIPAFRIKIDAVPGMVTSIGATPDRIGSFDTDANYRLQCAEMCGLGHNSMAMPVRVVTRAEYDQWISEQNSVRQ